MVTHPLTYIQLSSVRRGIVFLCICITMLAYLSARNMDRNSATTAFQQQVADSHNALISRMDRYAQALNVGVAYFAASDQVTASEWREFVQKLDLEAALPGASGLGYIVPVGFDETDKFFGHIAHGENADPETHTVIDLNSHFFIKYIEPLETNRAALGLDIAFEDSRRNAAILARDTGLARMTARISLVQDQTRQPGFLLLLPHYANGATLVTAEDRRAAFRGWVYSPFVGASALKDMTPNQGKNFQIAVYDGTTASDDALIYDSAGGTLSNSKFFYSSAVDVYGQVWTINWRSTPAFEISQASRAPVFILFSGLIATALIGTVLNMHARRELMVSDQVRIKTRELVSLQEETRSIADNAVVPILVMDDDNVILSANQAAIALMKQPRASVIGAVFPHAAMGDADTTTKRVTTVLSPNGKELTLDIQCNRWTSPSGRGRTTVILRDVTAEVKAAQRVAETEQRWDLALKGAKIGVFDIDLRAGSSVVSQTWRRLMQLEDLGPDENPQSIFLSRIHPDDLEILTEADAACLRGESERSIAEYRVNFGALGWRWMRSDAVVVERDTTGAALRLVGAQTDVTDIRRAREELESARSQFALLLQNAPVGMAILNEAGLFIGLNGALSDFTGYSREELIAKANFDVLMSKGDMALVLSKIGPHAADRDAAYQGEHLIRRRNGEEMWGLLSMSWTYDPELKADIYIAQVQDITEKKNVEKVKSEFVAVVSHELRTPLTSIKGSLGLLQMSVGKGVDPAKKRLVDIAADNTNRLIALVNDILDIEKMTAGKFEFAYADIILQDALVVSAQDNAPLADTFGVKIVTELPEPPIEVTVDSGRLAQVLANLLSNACKFSDPGGTVTVRLETVSGQAIVSVQDNGIGVPMGFSSQIFSPFSQADTSDTRKTGGTGLGLSISKQIIEQMGGRIGYESRPGLTVFWFSLPICSQMGQADLVSVDGIKQAEQVGFPAAMTARTSKR